MSNARLLRGSMAVGALVLASGSAVAGDLKPADVGKQLAGEWSGQIQMRSADDKLSASLASMSAVRNARNSTLELYYEGFAFGKAVEGAMILSFDRDLPSLSIRDPSSGTRSAFRMDRHAADAGRNSLVMSSRSAQGSELRAVFSRDSRNAWDIELQEQDKDGQWVPTLVLQLDRLDHGQRSAAAERFSQARSLMSLRRDHAIASVPTD